MYDWAVNLSKLQRAEAACPGGTEEEIKGKYIALGGKVLNYDEELTITKEGATKITKVTNETQDETSSSENPLVVAKKKRLSRIA